MANLKHSLNTYECRHCHDLYTCHPFTMLALQGYCWQCTFVMNLSASVVDNYLNGIEQEMCYEGYDIPMEDC